MSLLVWHSTQSNPSSVRKALGSKVLDSDSAMEASNQRALEDGLNDLIDLLRQKVISTDFPLKRRTDAQFLAKFLRSKKYNVDKAFNALEKYYTNLYSNIRLVNGIHPVKFSDTYKMNTFRLLKNNFNGAKIVHVTINRWDTKIASLRDLEISATFILEEIFQDLNFQLHGAIGIVDLTGLAFCHVRQATYSEIKFAIKVGLEMFPLKVAGIHILNAPTIFWPVYKIGLKFLPKKIQERCYIHSNLDELRKALSPEILPKSLGGVLEEEEAFDSDLIPTVLQRNLPYECYWNGDMERPYRPRRLSRKRSSALMS